ncbi:rna-directed dna polymerase from mobile element jockey- hypothetical protein [Limosa lapponica baueri]|uniref:Reverse transcriptase domain-containing protein n=1 Tax=Limosa lapponica baueri TaxID=1758121 RepID=A0A2I0T5Z4_LIMLA|nr:rna-directed dna polymerase from mobile element jockey- hypothetical protein [Limosa lapponica baueri]
MRKLADVVARLLSINFERSWRLGEISQDWRKGNVTPIFEKGKKVMEQLILETISRRMEDKEVIRSSQHGFTKGRSCLTNLITFHVEMNGLVDEGSAVDIVYLAFRKAFDTVSKDPYRQAVEVWAG